MSARTKHVLGVFILVCEMPPVCNGKHFGEACYPDNEVVFPGVDGLFGGVGPVDVQWCVLEGGAMGFDEVINVARCFSVHFV